MTATPITSIEASNSLADLAARIRQEHEAAVAALNSAVVHAMTAGDLLIEAKAQVPHGSWRGWVADNCKLSERSIRLYMQLAKHRGIVEKELAKSAMGVADLTLNEAAALCVLAGRLERLMDFAKRAEGCGPEQLVDLCIKEGFTPLVDEGYDPFYGRSEEEKREWILFGYFIGGGSSGAFDHVEWLLQRPFQNVDEWLGPEGTKFRKPTGWQDSPPKFHKAWARFKAEYADKTCEDILAEVAKVSGGGGSYLLGRALENRNDRAASQHETKGPDNGHAKILR
jgi:Protein of unknown function (DUF3102)